MKFIKGYKTFESKERISPAKLAIIQICEKYRIENYTINDDFTIDVDDSVFLNQKDLTELPLNFNRVTGNFYCADNNLRTLKGSPKYVGGDFHIHRNELTNLEYSPEVVAGSYFVHSNKINTLDGLKNVEFSNITLEDNLICDISYRIALKTDMEREEGGIGDNPVDILIYSLIILSIGDKDKTENEIYLEIIERIEEFEVIKYSTSSGLYNIDIINLNRLFDFYEKEFDEDEVKDLIETEFNLSDGYEFEDYYRFV